MPNISVVVPVYNTAEYLDECIESILNQSYRDIELILIDDGSTDRSGEICDKYKAQDKRVAVVHTPNRGKIMARREGVILAKSPYVTFVDSDDFLDEHAYEYAVDDMKKGIDVICFGIRRYRKDGDSIEQASSFLSKEYSKSEISQMIFPKLIWPFEKGIDPSLCIKIIKRDFLLDQYEKIKDLNIDYAEDSVTIYPILKKINSMSEKNKIYYNHRQTVGAEKKYYILDVNYYDKLYKVYAYLKEEFSNMPTVLEQIDKFYIKSINYKHIQLHNYNITKANAEKINSYETVILYGAGQVAKRVIPYLSDIGIDKFIVSVTKAGDDEHIFGNKVFSINEICCDKSKTVVLLAVALRNQPEIVKTLKNMGYGNVTSVV